MTDPATEPGRRSARAGTILDAARQLILRQGFKAVTMASVAQHAHVGKGTAYQYWRTKEELFLELLAGELADVLDELAAQVRADPAVAQPDLLCVTVTRSWVTRPLIRALQTSDDLVLGGLIDQPGALDLVKAHGSGPILRDLLPVWRTYEIVRTDWPARQQADAVSLLVIGYFSVADVGPQPDADQEHTLQLALQGMLQLREPAAADRERLAEEVAAVLTAHADRARAAVG
ncbi:TetR/AcrR family transcriptional regulator [Microlunatus sp. GCM10028923]|uniref:TetR/AcrR family transcriptional regulator n=1 Tax=Microlunatus sp. GCM10028923 TaxID=3273400 RepID=UPI0036209A24